METQISPMLAVSDGNAAIQFYGAAFGGWLHQNLRRRLKVLTVPYTVCLLSWATVVGFYRFAAGRQFSSRLT